MKTITTTERSYYYGTVRSMGSCGVPTKAVFSSTWHSMTHITHRRQERPLDRPSSPRVMNDQAMADKHHSENDKGDDNDDDEEEDDDEDYIPGVDPDDVDDDDDEDNDNNGGAALRGASSSNYALSLSGRKAADEAFLDLFGYPYHQHQQLSKEGSIIHDNDQRMQPKNDPTTTNYYNNSNHRRAIHILSTIFGKRFTSTLLSNSKFNAKFARPKDRALSGGMIRLERRVIHETKRFAGREIKVEKVVLVPVFANDAANNTKGTITNAVTIDTSDGTSVGDTRTTASNPTSTSAATATTTTTTTRGPRPKRGGLDNLLSQISRPDKLSTMSKTAADWDMFKSSNVDLATKLEDTAMGNEAYLVKKDFLNRVDTRQFELEKAQREKERAARR